MPLSRPAPRQLIHTRSIRVEGYQRDDGLWDIEASLIDTKTYSFANQDRGGIRAGEPVHHMLVRLTLDDRMLVHQAETSTEAAPFFCCPDINPAFSELAGLSIKSGWRQEVLTRFGRVRGCTHIVDLLVGPIAQTAHQTIAAARLRRHGAQTEALTEPPTDAKATAKRPKIIDSCHALAADGPVVEREWPQHSTRTD